MQAYCNSCDRDSQSLKWSLAFSTQIRAWFEALSCSAWFGNLGLLSDSSPLLLKTDNDNDNANATKTEQNYIYKGTDGYQPNGHKKWRPADHSGTTRKGLEVNKRDRNKTTYQNNTSLCGKPPAIELISFPVQTKFVQQTEQLRKIEVIHFYERLSQQLETLLSFSPWLHPLHKRICHFELHTWG